ncbi:MULTISPECIES: mycothiol system anti-sigma-R factor [unclassified Nocardioides]|uniref:mycothiol system anti-sigma-R factor n=1 Tax=unclassified Nocardioides TaxID=2615069 RepID=UPI0006F9E94A|nr:MULTISPECIES: mycothiol system anti-sigma-R factor [unclassified Nocardioides]KQY54471.1 anti-sigma factor [Nocardioides sp. Root140]KQZ66347.1 anti-sigma factor [Nocardioides sp. Root151]KRF19547.1 anti-sigma factor [Nocardioides sp. Soil796]
MTGQNETEDCSDFLERIVYLIDNELDEADCSVVRQHLDECGPCLAKYDLERTVKAVVARSCSESAPQGLRERVLVQLRQVQVRITEQ